MLPLLLSSLPNSQTRHSKRQVMRSKLKVRVMKRILRPLLLRCQLVPKSLSSFADALPMVLMLSHKSGLSLTSITANVEALVGFVW